MVPQQAVELSRDYMAPPADSIGTTSERELLARELRRDMAAAILRRVDAALTSKPVARATTSRCAARRRAADACDAALRWN